MRSKDGAEHERNEHKRRERHRSAAVREHASGDKVFPFVTLAGDPSAPADKREQLEVRTGYERISKLDVTRPRPGSDANTRYKAIFKHDGDDYDVYGSVFDDGTNKVAALREAYDNNTPIIYRIEKYRKRKARKRHEAVHEGRPHCARLQRWSRRHRKSAVGHAVG